MTELTELERIRLARQAREQGRRCPCRGLTEDELFAAYGLDVGRPVYRGDAESPSEPDSSGVDSPSHDSMQPTRDPLTLR